MMEVSEVKDFLIFSDTAAPWCVLDKKASVTSLCLCYLCLLR
jgi:hypothetical protein